MLGANTTNSPCYFFKFAVIVTGKGEKKHLAKLFDSLAKSGICYFEVTDFVGQLSPRKESPEISMIDYSDKGKKIPPDNKAEAIAFTARFHLSQDRCTYVLLVDDLEYDRRGQEQQVFNRYRNAFDIILNEQKYRASVHFLVNMLEAYYFADSAAVNEVLKTSLTDYEGDVETIRHPKNDLKKIYNGFDEVRDGGEILKRLDVTRVLSRPDTCASLRTLFAWCSKILEKYPIPECLLQSPIDEYRILDGILSIITGKQLKDIE